MSQTATLQAGSLAYSPDSRKAPWNVMGGDLTTEHANVADALAATGLDYEVEVRDLASIQHDDEGRVINNSLIEAPNLRTIVRPMADGSTKVLAATGKRFTPIQNREAFKVADLLVSEYGAKIAGAADFRTGGASLLVVDLQRPIRLPLGNGMTDEMSLNLLIKNAHDASSALTFALTPMRLACTNALQAAIGNAKRVWKISHTPNADARVGLARQSIIAALNYQDTFAEKAAAMLDRKMVDAEFDKIVAGLFPVDDDKAETKVGERRLAIRANIKALYAASPTLEGIRGTRWGAYNALTEWADWGRAVNTGDAGRAEGSLEGAPVRMKGRFWDLLAV